MRMGLIKFLPLPVLTKKLSEKLVYYYEEYDSEEGSILGFALLSAPLTSVLLRRNGSMTEHLRVIEVAPYPDVPTQKEYTHFPFELLRA